jgi:uncharacterized membrane protein
MVSESTLKAIVAMVCVTALQIVNFLTVRLDTGIMTMVITAISIFAGYQIGYRVGYYKRAEEVGKSDDV